MILSILFTILKVILWIVIIALLLLLYLLICPFFINGRFVLDDEKKISFTLKSFAHFFQLSYDDSLKISVFGKLLVIYPDLIEKHKSKPDNKARKQDSNKSKESTQNETDFVEAENVINDSKEDNTVKHESSRKNDTKKVASKSDSKKTGKKKTKKNNKKKSKKKSKKNKKRFEKAKALKLKKNIEYFTRPDVKAGIGYILKCLGSLLASFSLNIKNTDVCFSLGSPDLTGQFLGVLAIVPYCREEKVIISADFETEELYAKGIINVNGHFSLINIVVFFVKVFIKKESRNVILHFL